MNNLPNKNDQIKKITALYARASTIMQASGLDAHINFLEANSHNNNDLF